jgi:hypothetical protein
MILQVQLFLDIHPQVLAYSAVLLVELIADNLQLFSISREVIVQRGEEDEPVVLKLVQVNCVFHHS